jgi:hypothetical protein
MNFMWLLASKLFKRFWKSQPHPNTLYPEQSRAACIGTRIYSARTQSRPKTPIQAAGERRRREE